MPFWGRRRYHSDFTTKTLRDEKVNYSSKGTESNHFQWFHSTVSTNTVFVFLPRIFADTISSIKLTFLSRPSLLDNTQFILPSQHHLPMLLSRSLWLQVTSWRCSWTPSPLDPLQGHTWMTTGESYLVSALTPCSNRSDSFKISVRSCHINAHKLLRLPISLWVTSLPMTYTRSLTSSWLLPSLPTPPKKFIIQTD